MNAEGYDPNGQMEFGPYDHWIRARTGAAVGRVRSALDEYKFNDAAAEIYAFVWGEYCDWYVELSKTTIYDESASRARKNAVQHTLFGTMSAIVRLLHPIAPFLSEEIWQRLPNTQGYVTTASYPRVDDYPRDDQVLGEVSLLQEVINEVRGMRGEMELARRVPLRLLIADARFRGGLEPHARALKELAGATVEALDLRPSGAATLVAGGQEMVVPLEGIVDFGAELQRLDKVLAKADKDVSQLEKRLASKGFRMRAPPEVVEEVQTKLNAARGRRSKLQASRERMQEALQ
jgi:valyl-tRNA synthetase